MNIKNLLSLILTWPITTSFAAETNELGLDQKIDKAFQPFSDFVSSVVFLRFLKVPHS